MGEHRKNKHALLFQGNCFLLIFLFFCTALYAENAGSRAAFTRSGYVGARYVGIGMTAEVLADDVYAIYWNPAGLSSLREKKKVTPEEVKEKVRRGDADKITEKDLLSFSEDNVDRRVVHVGASASILDVSRQVCFSGVAFNLLGGVAGIGLYSAFSLDIETYDETGASTGKTQYVAGAAYFSYAYDFGIASIGASLKTLYERIDKVNYGGAGVDLGTQVYVLPFLKVGFMVQDLGAGLVPMNSEPGVEKKYDLAYPTLRAGISLISDSGITVAVSIIKKLEQDKYHVSAGVQYDLARYLSLYLGINDSYFASGMTINLYNMTVSYAFSFDNVDYGVNNTVSFSLLF